MPHIDPDRRAVVAGAGLLAFLPASTPARSRPRTSIDKRHSSPPPQAINPIENLFAKLKAFLRKRAERSVDALWTAVGDAIRTVPALAADGDCKLLRLGALFDAAWSEQAALGRAGDDINEPYDRAHKIVLQIERLPAATIAGLIVKTRACSWCHSGEPFEPNSSTASRRTCASPLRSSATFSPSAASRSRK